MAAFLAIVALPLISPDSSSAQTPGQAEDPAAAKQHAPRGSALELERFGRHILPTRKATASSSEAAGQGAEVSDVLDPKERPSLKFLRQGKTLSKSGKPAKQKGGAGPASAGAASGSGAPGGAEPQLPQHQNKLEDSLIRNPGDFLVEYSLESDAEVAVAVIGADGMEVRRFEIPAGAPGGCAGLNRVIYWDGQDALGREAPAGDYQAIQSIRYGGADGKRVETRLLPLRK
ncbi:MAG: hypothetical protein A2X36_17420 [Elusimicrobia bacterium GWA2_69_24]|nr:MAG: hypothetical protein A2X36_17420 [Elusimicrobia bacterium GWA2_69_24]